MFVQIEILLQSYHDISQPLDMHAELSHRSLDRNDDLIEVFNHAADYLINLLGCIWFMVYSHRATAENRTPLFWVEARHIAINASVANYLEGRFNQKLHTGNYANDNS